MILCRTPYYITIPINCPATTTDVVVSLYIWSGLQASVPGTANYTWTKPVPSTSTSELKINISNVINDYIEQTLKDESATDLISSAAGHGIWAYYKVEYTDGTETIADLTGTLLALEGYGTYLDGINPDIPANKILLDGDYFQMSRSGYFCIGFVNDGTYASITINDGGTIYGTPYVPVSSTDSDEIINYIWIDGSDFNNDTITIVFGANTITIDVIDEGKYTTNDILFFNKYGAQQILTFFKKKTESLKVESKTFNNNYVSGGTYDISKHQTKQYNKKGNKSFNMVSGFYDEENNNVFEQLLLSEKVWLYNGTFIPVNVESRTLNTKTQINDKLIGYDVSFSYAFNQLNDV